MQIELYKVEEVKGELDNLAADANACELIDKLNLAGQKKLVDTKTMVRVAFRRMTEVENKVYSLLFPEQTRVEKFDTEIIPIRVLEALQEATDTKQFTACEIWHSRTRKEDPILIGLIGEKNPQTWNPDYMNITGRFLIARWGEALLPFEKLLEQAKKLWLNKEQVSIKRQIAEYEERLSSLKEQAEIDFANV